MASKLSSQLNSPLQPKKLRLLSKHSEEIEDDANLSRMNEHGTKAAFDNETLKDMQSVRKHRNKMLSWTIVIVSIYLIVVLGVIIMQVSNASLSDSVIVTLLSTTTITVIGLPLAITRALFYIPKDMLAKDDIKAVNK